MAVRAKKRAIKVTAYVDGPTPERMRHDNWSMVAPPQGGAGKSLAKVHKVVVAGSVDHLYHLGALSFWQWEAARQYRELMQDGWPEPRVCGAYEGRQSPANDPSPVPLSAKAERARRRLRAIDNAIPLVALLIVKNAIANDSQPERGRKRKVQLDELRLALSALGREMGLSA
jgi:hypothetical protein